MYHDVTTTKWGNQTLSLQRQYIRCTAPGRFHLYKKRVCGKYPAESKVTQMMVGDRTPPGGFTTQPMWLCREHWAKYPEVSAMTGEKLSPQRRWPGGR